MYICICKVVTDSDIRQAVSQGAKSMRELREMTGLASQCGRCAKAAKCCLREAVHESAGAVPQPAFA
ncbi:MAG: (2Fe-2S)-binding protein [Gammaproteobacteria bacterium]